MASNIILNGSTYSGTPTSGTLFKPVSIDERIVKVGTVIVAESGARTLVQRAAKGEWTIHWKGVPESTRVAVRILAALGSTFVYVSEYGTSYTVQTEPGDHKCSTAFTTPANVIYYDIDLTMHEA